LFRAINNDGRQLYPLRPMKRLPPQYHPQPVDYDKGIADHINYSAVVFFYSFTAKSGKLVRNMMRLFPN